MTDRTAEQERAAVEWLRKAVAAREAGVQHDKEHHRRSCAAFDVERARDWATIPNMSLRHAMTLLAMIESREHLRGEGEG
jgi:hypothetical protein